MNAQRLAVPRRYQKKGDNTCGPTCIRMILDYFRQGQSVTRSEWEDILRSTMKGNIHRESGTSRDDMVKTIRGFGLTCRKIPGVTKDEKLRHLASALRAGRPAILWCRAYFQAHKRYAHYVVLTGLDET